MINDQDKPEIQCPTIHRPTMCRDAPGEPGGHAPDPYPPADPDERGVAD